MACVTITIRDKPDGTISITAVSEPPFRGPAAAPESRDTAAQITAACMLSAVIKDARENGERVLGSWDGDEPTELVKERPLVEGKPS